MEILKGSCQTNKCSQEDISRASLLLLNTNTTTVQGEICNYSVVESVCAGLKGEQPSSV